MHDFKPHNIPYSRTPEGDRLRELIRKVFQAPPGPLIQIDYAEIELQFLRKPPGR